MSARCGEKFTGSVMVPLQPPSVGWEPLWISDTCTREKDHHGPHSGKELVLQELGRAGVPATP